MLVPSIKHQIKRKNEEFTVKSFNEYIRDSYIGLFSDIVDDSDKFSKYIKYIEKLVRRSFEYKYYIFTLKNDFDLTKCKFFRNIDIDETNVGLEFHHYPFTLYDIVFIVINDKLEELKSNYGNYETLYSQIFDPFYIANEVVELHFKNIIGLVPLTLTVHELVHTGQIFIPLNKDYVFGDYKAFIKKYNCNVGTYMDKIRVLNDLTKDIEEGKSEFDLSKLTINKTKIEMVDATIPEKVELLDEVSVS